jgi:uncharacterized protein YndB with AHSA1/START domain
MPELSSDEVAERTLIISRTFDAPVELVWKAWADPDQMVRWIGPEGFGGDIIKMDARPGGSYHFHMRGPEGDHWVRGVYREIVEHQRLVYTWAWADAAGNATRPETLLTITFAARGRKTELTLRQEVFESVTARDMHQGGWNSTFNKLAKFLAEVR